jgi:hypothetical protein
MQIFNFTNELFFEFRYHPAREILYQKLKIEL